MGLLSKQINEVRQDQVAVGAMKEIQQGVWYRGSWGEGPGGGRGLWGRPWKR